MNKPKADRALTPRQPEVSRRLPAPKYVKDDKQCQDQKPPISPIWDAPTTATRSNVLATLADESVALVMTSPPFALRRKKAYGNVAADQYIDWFMPFARQIHRVLRTDGSFVMDLGGAWNAGSGTRSLFPYELILKLGKIFRLAQDFYWYNPSRLPTPAEWVTIRRTRVKDAVTTLWWLSKSDEPQADNRRVLKPYSKSMSRLLKDGYKPARRPSQHDIGPHFQRDNGGAIPPNLLTIPNTRSSESYLIKCKAAGLQIHPARFPPEVPEFFIRFLTQPGQLGARSLRRQQHHGIRRRIAAAQVDQH